VLARAQLKLADNPFKNPLSSDDLDPQSGSLPQQTPPFLRRESPAADQEWQRHAFNWSAAIAVGAIVAPVTIGAGLGHPIVGVVIGAIGLLGVGLLAFGFWVLDNTLTL
jgi:hypothetical protein